MGSTETIHTTANHPWLTADRGWVVAGALRSGEVVVTLDGQRGVVVTTQAVAGHAAMDTLTVADDHTYAVGSGQWVVHNDNAPDASKTIYPGEYQVGLSYDESSTWTGDTTLHPLVADQMNGRSFDTFDQARKAAFYDAGLTSPAGEPLVDITVTEVDEATYTAVEFKGPDGQSVGYDGPHLVDGVGHDSSHISWRNGGKGETRYYGNYTYPETCDSFPHRP